MTRDFTKDLTIMVAGSGNATLAHLEEALADWIFGSVDEREVHVILPVLSQMGAGVRNLIKLGSEWEFKFTVIQAKDAPMTRELSAVPEDSFIRVDGERAALERALALITDDHRKQNETAVLLAYDPKSTYEQGDPSLSDYEILGDVKNYPWLTTLNLCEGFIDSFEGFKTTNEILKEEQLKKEFAEKQALEEAAKPKPVKKTTAPRKRASKKVEPQESTQPLAEAEKPLEDVPVGTTVEVGGIEFTKHSDNPFSKPKHNGPNPHRAPLPGNPIHDQKHVHQYQWIDDDNGRAGSYCICGEEEPRANELSASVKVDLTPMKDVWSDVDEAQRETSSTVAVSREDLAELSQNIKELTGSFGKIMDTFTRILKDG